LPGRKAGRQHAPRHATAQDIEDGVDQFAQRPGGRRPTGEAGGNSGSRTAHSASVTSLAKRSPSRICCARVVAVHMAGFIQLGLDNPLEPSSTVITQPPFR
jgi:hypothetical protein